MAFDLTQTQVAGIEDLDQGGKMPNLRILQDLSPEVRKQKEEYIEGAEVGDIYFAGIEGLVKKPLEIIPLRMRALYTEWIPRDQGGGLEAIHPLTITADPRYEKGRKTKFDEWLGNNELLMTHYWFLLINVNGEWVEAILPMTKSQLRVSRALQSAIKKFRYPDNTDIVPPIFANKILLDTVYEENSNGDGYFNWKIGDFTVLDPEADEALLTKAHETGKTADAALPEPETNASRALPGNSDADVEVDEAF